VAASIGPLGCGAIHDATGGWTVPMLASQSCWCPSPRRLGACRDRHVLAAQGRSGYHVRDLSRWFRLRAPAALWAEATLEAGTHDLALADGFVVEG